MVGTAFSTFRFNKYAFDFGANRRHLPQGITSILRVVVHERKDLTAT
ncbi:hypothetical protein AB0C98_11020 [Streptomyces sp. NPDC048558]